MEGHTALVPKWGTAHGLQTCWRLRAEMTPAPGGACSHTPAPARHCRCCLLQDPRSPLFRWTARAHEVLPWLSDTSKTLSLLLRRSLIFEELNVRSAALPAAASSVMPVVAACCCHSPNVPVLWPRAKDVGWLVAAAASVTGVRILGLGTSSRFLVCCWYIVVLPAWY